MAGHYAYMKKEGEAIKKVPMNEWARYRRTGHAFSSEEAYNEQQAKQVKEKPKAAKKKVSKKKS